MAPLFFFLFFEICGLCLPKSDFWTFGAVNFTLRRIEGGALKGLLPLVTIGLQTFDDPKKKKYHWMKVNFVFFITQYIIVFLTIRNASYLFTFSNFQRDCLFWEV